MQKSSKNIKQHVKSNCENRNSYNDKFNDLFSLLINIKTFSIISKSNLYRLAEAYQIDADSLVLLISIYGGEVNYS